MERRLQTASNGAVFDPLNINRDVLGVEVIAHALANICRFGGHMRQFYSVAQHSVHVSQLVPAQFALQALLHDAPEAFLGDIPSPLKNTPEFSGYRDAEDRAWNQISMYYGVELELSSFVKEADAVALATEIRDFMPASGAYNSYADPDSERLRALLPDSAEEFFLERFMELVPTWSQYA